MLTFSFVKAQKSVLSAIGGSLLVSCMLLSSSAMAAQERPQPPKLPLDKISTALNVTVDELQTCLDEGKPAAPGEEPNKAALLACLQNLNPDITADSLEKVMKDNRPPRRDHHPQDEDSSSQE